MIIDIANIPTIGVIIANTIDHILLNMLVKLPYFIIEAMTQLVRVFITYPKIQLPIHYFFTKIIFPVTTVTVASLIVPTIIHYYCDINKFIEFIGISIIYLLSSVLCIYLLGLQKTEKEMIQDKFINKIFKR